MRLSRGELDRLKVVARRLEPLHSKVVFLGGAVVGLLVTAPYFIATKLAAFASRGHGDYLRSPDIEDVVIVLDGRPELAGEIETGPVELRQFLSSGSRALLETRAFREALAGHLDPDEASQAREGLILRRLQQIADLNR